MNKRYNYLLLLFSAGLVSCTQMLYTSIDVLRPARVYFPTEVQNIVIINNADSQPHDLGHTIEYFYKPVEKVEINTDSLPLFALSSFHRTVSEKEFFNSTKLILDYKPDNSKFINPKPLFKSAIDSIMILNDAKAAISLNRIVVQDVQAELLDESDNSFIAYLEAKYELHWSVYDLNSSNSTSLITRDTLYWESQSYVQKKAQSGLPNRYNALVDGAILAGEKAVEHFIPHWEKADRYFFNSNNSKFKAGIDSVYHMNWNGAIKVWESLYANENNAYTRAKLANNLAIVYEINGDIESAAKYADQALGAFNSLPIVDYRSFLIVIDYLEDINIRKKEIKKINLQLGK